jgi:hypothetical protein
MLTPRKPTIPTTEAIDQVCCSFDDLVGRFAARTAVRHYLIGLLLAEASAEQVYARYRLRDGIEHYDKSVQRELGWADYQMRSERAIVRHWQLVLLASTCSLLVGVVPATPPGVRVPATTAPAAVLPAPPLTPVASTGGGKIGTRVDAGGVGHHAAAGVELALPVGTAATLLAMLVAQRPTARTGRAPRPRRPLPSAWGTGDGACRPDLTNQRLGAVA